MARVIGLDVGDKRVGVALSDPSLLLASPLGVFERAGGAAENKVLALAAEHKVERIVVGMPYGENGEENEQCVKIRNFCRRLKRRSSVQIGYIDEYFSSVEAAQHLEESLPRRRGRGRKTSVDAAAACLILQRFLDGAQALSVPFS